MIIKVGTTKIKDIIKEIDGKEINGVTFKYTGKTMGITASFEHNAKDYESAKQALKTYLKSSDDYAALFVSYSE